MPTKEEILEGLKTQTKEDIEKRKHYALKTPPRFKNIKGYNIQYLQKTINGNWKPPHPLPKDSQGDDVKFNSAPIANYNTLLAMAFYKAQQLFSSLMGEKIEDKEPFTMDEIEKAREGEPNPITPIEFLTLSKQLLQGKNSSLIKALKKGEMEQINDMSRVLKTVYKALNELRNYHAHILHEPGPVMFKNLYGDSRPAKKLSPEEWETARNWFKQKMEEVRRHLIKSREQELKKTTLSEKERTGNEKVLKRIKEYTFEHEGYLTHDALLFIACMFLRKSDAEYFIRKWTVLKKSDEIFKKTRTFFTYYSIKDKKSLQTQNTDLLKFRKITGILSTMPEFTNLCFAPFNKFLHQHNDKYGEFIEHERNKQEKEKLNAHCIPLRKKFNPIYWYLDYLYGKGLLKNFNIACYKTPEERWKFLLQHNITHGILQLKTDMKRAKGEEKKRLTAIYKECKKNFTFHSSQENDLNYCSKNENAIFQYTFTDDSEKKEVTVQANLSCDLLMKWAFAEILWKKGEDIKTKVITSFMKSQYHSLKNGQYEKAKVLPPSIKKAEDNPELKYSVSKAQCLIKAKNTHLYAFQAANSAKRAPWKYEAKRKLDIIFDFVHISYTRKALKEAKNTDQRRHEALNDLEYLDALDLLRFYGKNYVLPEFKKMFFEDKKIYFEGIKDCMEQAQTLEELYTAVFNKQKNFYKEIKKNLNDKNLAEFIALFTPRKASGKATMAHHAALFAINQVIPHERIDIREMATEMPEYQEWKATVKDAKRTTDFSLMRHILCKRNPTIDTNSDYLMKIIMPVLLTPVNMEKYLADVLLAGNVKAITKPVRQAIKTKSYKEMALPENDTNKIKGNTSLFNTLMKNKTDELMLWEIAKTYWCEAYGKNYSISSSNYKFRRGDPVKDNPYKTTLFFYKVFAHELIVPLGEGIQIKIKPKKFDDEFQYYETKNISRFIQDTENNSESFKDKNGYYDYERLNKDMKDYMAKYLDDIYLLLLTEKQVVKENYDALTAIIDTSYETNWEGYHFTFSDILAEKIYQKIAPESGQCFTLENLNDYRNKIFHQEIQPDKKIYKNIRKALFEYCLKNNILT